MLSSKISRKMSSAVYSGTNVYMGKRQIEKRHMNGRAAYFCWLLCKCRHKYETSMTIDASTQSRAMVYIFMEIDALEGPSQANHEGYLCTVNL